LQKAMQRSRSKYLPHDICKEIKNNKINTINRKQ